MKISALAPWFGAKRNLAAEIIVELGPHSAYWEPFCGSMAVLLAKESVASETVNDLHGDLINLARVVAHDRLHQVLFERLRRTLAAEPLHRAAAARYRERSQVLAGIIPDVERAYDYFLSSWLGRNGVAGTDSYNQGFCKRFTKNGGHAATRWIGAIDSIPPWFQRLRSVTILAEDGISLIERIEDASGVVVYCDPPYLAKGAKYVHDFELADHERLAAALHRFQRTRVVVSYYDHPRLRTLYPDWSIRRLRATKSLVNQGMRDAGGRVDAPELLLINGPSLIAERSLFGAETLAGVPA